MELKSQISAILKSYKIKTKNSLKKIKNFDLFLINVSIVTKRQIQFIKNNLDFI